MTGMQPIDTTVTMDFCAPDGVSADLYHLLTGTEPGTPIPDPVHELEMHATLPGRLQTGTRPRGCSRAEHARLLRVARLRRRVARREHRPVRPIPVMLWMRGRLATEPDGSFTFTAIDTDIDTDEG